MCTNVDSIGVARIAIASFLYGVRRSKLDAYFETRLTGWVNFLPNAVYLVEEENSDTDALNIIIPVSFRTILSAVGLLKCESQLKKRIFLIPCRGEFYSANRGWYDKVIS